MIEKSGSISLALATIAILGQAPRTAVDASETGVVYKVFGSAWKVIGETPGFRDAVGCGFGVDRAAWTGTGRAIVLMQRPYDSRCKKANDVSRYDIFGRHRLRGDQRRCGGGL